MTQRRTTQSFGSNITNSSSLGVKLTIFSNGRSFQNVEDFRRKPRIHNEDDSMRVNYFKQRRNGT